MKPSATKRAETLIQTYQDKHDAIQPDINALEAKIQQLKNSTRVPDEEHCELLQQLNKLNDPNRADGNGARIGIAGVARYVRLINSLKRIPTIKTKRPEAQPTGANQPKPQRGELGVLERTIDGALYEDGRAREVTRLVMQMVKDKKISVGEADIILNQFLYEPVGSSGRDIGESRLEATKYN